MAHFLKKKQLICPNLPHSKAIFVKVVKSIIFLVKSFLGNFCRHGRFFMVTLMTIARIVITLS